MPDSVPLTPLVQAQELAKWLSRDEPQRPVVVDVRWTLGRGVEGNRAEYRDGHIPDAGFLDLETALAGHPRPDGVGGRHPLPETAAATEAFRAVGITASRPVVFYDGATSLAAARAWWVAQFFGKHDAYVLNGGYAAWLAAAQTSVEGDIDVRAGDVSLAPGGRDAIEADDVAAYGSTPTSTSPSTAPHRVLIDARASQRYRGDVEPIDPVAGHIPGALNLATLGTLRDDGRFDLAAARAHLADLDIDDKMDLALYCGSGVQAAHLALTIEAAQPGGTVPAVYVGSWSDWVSDPDRPVATGD